jgi:hypothetical protein
MNDDPFVLQAQLVERWISEIETALALRKATSAVGSGRAIELSQPGFAPIDMGSVTRRVVAHFASETQIACFLPGYMFTPKIVVTARHLTPATPTPDERAVLRGIAQVIEGERGEE